MWSSVLWGDQPWGLAPLKPHTFGHEVLVKGQVYPLSGKENRSTSERRWTTAVSSLSPRKQGFAVTGLDHEDEDGGAQFLVARGGHSF